MGEWTSINLLEIKCGEWNSNMLGLFFLILNFRARAQGHFYFFFFKLIIFIHYNLKLLHFPIIKIPKGVMSVYTKNLIHPQMQNTYHNPRYFCDWKI